MNELFAGLGEAQRHAVAQLLRRRRYPKGGTIFHAGDPGDTIHFVAKGHVAVRVSTPLGEVATVAVLGPDDFFGELALIAPDSARTASIVALDPVETLALHHRDFNDLRDMDPRVDRLLIAVLAAQVRRLTGQVLDLMYSPTDVRIIRRLHDLARQYRPGVQGAPIEVPLTQDDLATMVGTTRPTANRVLKDLAAEKVIELHRGRIVVVALDVLAKRAR